MSLWPPRREDQAKLDVRSRAQVRKGGQAARRKAAPRGAKGWLRVSMCQIAWASRRIGGLARNSLEDLDHLSFAASHPAVFAD